MSLPHIAVQAGIMIPRPDHASAMALPAAPRRCATVAAVGALLHGVSGITTAVRFHVRLPEQVFAEIGRAIIMRRPVLVQATAADLPVTIIAFVMPAKRRPRARMTVQALRRAITTAPANMENLSAPARRIADRL